MNTIESVIGFYQNFSASARAGMVRNADPLAAFLRALDEANYADIPCPCQ